INLKPKAVKYFKQNYPLLLKSVTLEWAKFLEKINKGLPMLISKIEGHIPERSSLEKAICSKQVSIDVSEELSGSNHLFM
ncbi:MAG TPA: hypothetical protein VFJ05_00785, partial [Nitrososphaeraceae archaeon]|nr:hypothetical protein [Nitrososphaeraceae archaeon]